MTLLGGVVQPDYDSCTDGPVGGVIEVPAAGPAGPTGPRGVPSFVFVFGSNRSALQVGERITHPIPTDLNNKTLSLWRARMLVSSAIEFLIYKAPSQNAAAVALTGTMPELAGQQGGSGMFTDLSDSTLQTGAVLEVEIVAVAGDVKQATLVLEINP